MLSGPVRLTAVTRATAEIERVGVVHIYADRLFCVQSFQLESHVQKAAAFTPI